MKSSKSITDKIEAQKQKVKNDQLKLKKLQQKQNEAVAKKLLVVIKEKNITPDQVIEILEKSTSSREYILDRNKKADENNATETSDSSAQVQSNGEGE